MKKLFLTMVLVLNVNGLFTVTAEPKPSAVTPAATTKPAESEPKPSAPASHFPPNLPKRCAFISVAGYGNSLNKKGFVIKAGVSANLAAKNICPMVCKKNGKKYKYAFSSGKYFEYGDKTSSCACSKDKNVASKH